MWLDLHAQDLRPEWLDAYGHLNEAYYLVVFSDATWAMQDHLGVGPAYSGQTRNALYTVETHIRYLKEVRAPARLVVRSSVLGFDSKRLHLGHVLLVDAVERATCECVLLHINWDTGRSAALPADRMAALQALPAGDLPDWSGARVSLQRRP